MGSMTYNRTIVHIDDRTLAHLQVVIVNKFRRGESFVLSWRDADAGGGRSSIWLHPAVPLHFKFVGSRAPAINRDWIHQLALNAQSPQGLVITGEARHDSDRTSRPKSMVGTSDAGMSHHTPAIED